MKVEARPLEGLPAGVSHPRSIDSLPGGGWIAAVCQEKGGRVVIHHSTGQVNPTDLRSRFPLVARAPDGHVIVAESRALRTDQNMVVLDPSGTVSARFNAGDDIAGLLASPDGVVCWYGDEGTTNWVGPAREGIAVFDFSGKLRLGYASGFKRVAITEVYGATWLGEGHRELAALCYPDFELLLLNIGTRDESVHRVPKKLHGACSLSATRADLYFFARSKDRIDRWRVGEKQVTSAKTQPVAAVRSIAAGCFVVRQSAGDFAVLSVVS